MWDLRINENHSSHPHAKIWNRYRGRGWFEPWPRTSWQGAKEPELAILKYEMILSFQSIWLILGKYDHLWFWVTGIWAPTFLVKVVTHKLYFSGVTVFSTLSADIRSRLKPPSDLELCTCGFANEFELFLSKRHMPIFYVFCKNGFVDELDQHVLHLNLLF